MNNLDRIGSQLQEAFRLQHLTLTLKEDHFVVENSSHEKVEKIRQIITDLKYCPWIFKSEKQDNITFTVVPYQIPTCLYQKPNVAHVIKWAQEHSAEKHLPLLREIAEEKGFELAQSIPKEILLKELWQKNYLKDKEKELDKEIQAISDFNSSIDSLLTCHLGEQVFKTHVAKALINGYRFVFIADYHTQQCFSSLLPDLIVKINQSKDSSLALFVEGCERDSISEQIFFSNCLKFQGKEFNTKSLLFGIEKHEIFLICDWIGNIHQLQIESHVACLLRYMLTKPTYQLTWNTLKKNNTDQNLKDMIAEIDVAKRIALKNRSVHPGIEKLKKGHFYHDKKNWINLFSKMIHVVLEEMNFPKEITTKIQTFLKNPSDNTACVNCLLSFNHQIRDPAIIENIRSVIQKCPQTTEIVIFIGGGHMLNVIQGLQAPFI